MSAATGQTPQPAQTAQQIQNQQDGGIEDPVEFANLLIVNQQFSQAVEFVRWVLADEDVPAAMRENLNYLLGLAYAGAGDHAAAAAVLREILDRRPADSHVRLVLGRVLFLGGNDSAAERQFDLVLADANINAATRQQALQHLAAIRDRNGWQFSSYFNVNENDNAQNAPEGDNRIVYIGGFPFQTNAEVEKTIGANLGFSGVHRRRVAANWQWENGVSYSGGVNAGAWDASTDVQASSGLRYLTGGGSVGAAAFASHRWEHGHPTSNGVGVRADASRVFGSRARASAAAQVLRSNSQINDAQDATVFYAQTRVNLGLSATTNGYWQLHATRNRARAGREAFVTAGSKIGARRDFGGGWTAGLDFSIARTLYDAPLSFIGYRHRFTHKTATLSLLKRDWRLWGFAPELTLVFNQRQSNIPIYSYDNRVVQLHFTRNF